jgi:6-phosphogluconolactonase
LLRRRYRRTCNLFGSKRMTSCEVGQGLALRLQTSMSFNATTCSLLMLVLAIGGCGAGPNTTGSGGGPSSAEILYVSDNGAILSYIINVGTGALQALGDIPFPDSVVDLRADPKGRFLYASDFNQNSVYAYSIDANTGSLTPINGSPFPFPGGVPRNGGPLAIDPGGKFLFYSNATGEIATFLIDQVTGALTPSSAGTQQDDYQPVQMVVHPTGGFLFTSNKANSSGGDFSVFMINTTTGALTPAAGSPFTFLPNSEPFGIAVHGSGKYLYSPLANSRGVEGIDIDSSTGALTAIQGSPFANQAFSADSVALDSLGKFLYVGNLSLGGVSAYTIDTMTGALTELSTSPYQSIGALALAVDPSGNFLFVSGNGVLVGEIQSYAIDQSSGMLTRGPLTTLPAQTSAQTLAIVSLK